MQIRKFRLREDSEWEDWSGPTFISRTNRKRSVSGASSVRSFLNRTNQSAGNSGPPPPSSWAYLVKLDLFPHKLLTVDRLINFTQKSIFVILIIRRNTTFFGSKTRNVTLTNYSFKPPIFHCKYFQILLIIFLLFYCQRIPR